jgi:hypothetical protein
MKMQQPNAALDPSFREQQPRMTMAKFALTHHHTLFNAVLGIPAGLGSDALRHTPHSLFPLSKLLSFRHTV